MDEDGELIAAEARGDVLIADAAADPLGDGGEQAVPGRVSERVVDDLEVVEVQE
jgi:hypothetical protein